MLSVGEMFFLPVMLFLPECNSVLKQATYNNEK